MINKYIIILILLTIIFFVGKEKESFKNNVYKVDYYKEPLEFGLPKGYVLLDKKEKSDKEIESKLKNIELEIDQYKRNKNIDDDDYIRKIVKRQIYNMYKNDSNSIRVLGEASKKLNDGNFVVPGDLNIYGKLSIDKEYKILNN